MRFIVTASLLLLTAAPAHSQIAAAVVAPGNTGTVQLDELGNGVFAVVAINLGADFVSTTGPGPICQDGRLLVSGTADTGTALVCLLGENGACSTIAAHSLVVDLKPGGVEVFGVPILGANGVGRVRMSMNEGRANPFDQVCGLHAGRVREVSPTTRFDVRAPLSVVSSGAVVYNSADFRLAAAR